MQDANPDPSVPKTSKAAPHSHSNTAQVDNNKLADPTNVQEKKTLDTTLAEHGGDRSLTEGTSNVTKGEKSKDGVVGDASVEELTEDEKEDESNHVTGTKLGLLSFGLCIALFVVALDNTIIGESRFSKAVLVLLTSTILLMSFSNRNT